MGTFILQRRSATRRGDTWQNISAPRSFYSVARSGAPIVAMLSGAAEPCPTRLGFPIWLEAAERGRNYPVFSTTPNAPWHFALRSGTLNTAAVRLPCVRVRVEPHGACNTLYLLLGRNHGEAFCRTTGSRRFERHRSGASSFSPSALRWQIPPTGCLTLAAGADALSCS